MAALDLRQGLRVEVVVVAGERTFLFNEGAALLPAGELRNEIVGRRKLDVDFHLLLQAWDRPQDRVAFGDDLQVHVRRARPPVVEHGCRASGQIHSGLGVRRSAELTKKAADSFLVYRAAHSAARSKLTSRRIRAL